MSFISTVLSPLLSFIGEPFVTSFHLGNKGTTRLREANRTPDFKAAREEIESIEKDKATVLIPEHIKTTIADFITNELNVDASRIVFAYSKEDSDYCTNYSLKYDGLAYLRIPSHQVAEIEKEFLPSHKFFIAHEVGHIVAEDCSNEGNINIKSCLLRALAYSVSSTTMSALFSNSSPAAMIGSHLASCAITKAAGFIYRQWVIQQQETLADAYAMKVSPAIAQGGIDGFKYNQLLNRFSRDEQLRPIAHELYAQGISSNIPRSCYLIACFAKGLMYVSDDGDLRYDIDHPPLSERVRLIQDHLAKNK